MSLAEIKSTDRLVEKILHASLGDVVTVLEENLECKIFLDIIEQNTPSPGTEFERKVTVSAGGLPLIRATIKFDKNFLPNFIVKKLLQKTERIGTILKNYDIPNKKNTVFLSRGKNNLFRIYEVKNNNRVWFTVSEEIKLDNLKSLLTEFPSKV